MATPFIGEIRMFAGTFAPSGWAFCNGQIINVRDNEALFSVIGTIYGGDGRTTFGLPDLRGRIPVHKGSGPGLTSRQIGRQDGTETETLATAHMPSHGHALQVTTNPGNSPNPVGRVPALAPVQAYSSTAPDVDFDGDAVASAGGVGTAHDNLMPFAVIHFIIALVGLIPSQT